MGKKSKNKKGTIPKELKKKAEKIEKILDELFPIVDPPLRSKDPYQLLVKVVLSAQCTDARVREIAPLLFEKADTPEEMVKLSPEEIEEVIRPCGLSKSKSRYIWELSRKLLEEFGGRVPDNFKDLESLPGVGHKSASVVMAQAFGKPAFPVDTHIHRLAKRWGLTEGKTVRQTEEDLKALFPPERWHKVHLQIIFFGRKYCPARNHKAESCPICSWASPDVEKKLSSK